MISRSFLTLSLSCFFAVAGCGAQTLDGGSSEGGASSGGSSGTNGSDTDAIAAAPLSGTIAGRTFEPKSIELQFSKANEQWFLTLRNYDVTCGVSSSPPSPAGDAMVVTIGAISPKAGTLTIAYGDAHAATFQIGVYDTSEKAVTRSAESGTLRFDSWDETPGAQITGALELEGGDSRIEGTFTATVCAAR